MSKPKKIWATATKKEPIRAPNSSKRPQKYHKIQRKIQKSYLSAYMSKPQKHFSALTATKKNRAQKASRIGSNWPLNENRLIQFKFASTSDNLIPIWL